MRSRIATLFCASTLAFSVAACGGGDDDKAEKLTGDDAKAAKALGKSMAGDAPSGYQKENAKCVSEGLVRKAGVDKLIEVKLITKDLKVAPKAPVLEDSKLAGQYADAWVDCADVDKQLESVKGQYPQASEADFDKYVSCIKKIPEADLREAVKESSLKGGDQAKVQKYEKAAQKCGAIIQPTTPAPQTPSEAPTSGGN